MIKLFKERDVKTPQRNKGDAGIDFYVPEATQEFLTDLQVKNAGKQVLIKTVLIQDEENGPLRSTQRMILPPMTDLLIPSGIRSKIDENYVLVLLNKSGVAVKQRLQVGAQVIDSSYEGEIHLHVTNISDAPTFIDFGQKLTQGVVIQHFPGEFEVVDGTEDTEAKRAEFFAGSTSERGDGGFGSTGTK